MKHLSKKCSNELVEWAKNLLENPPGPKNTFGIINATISMFPPAPDNRVNNFTGTLNFPSGIVEIRDTIGEWRST
jgi:hypothetical protein